MITGRLDRFVHFVHLCLYCLGIIRWPPRFICTVLYRCIYTAWVWSGGRLDTFAQFYTAVIVLSRHNQVTVSIQFLQFCTGSGRTPINGFKYFIKYLENYRQIVEIRVNFVLSQDFIVKEIPTQKDILALIDFNTLHTLKNN